MKKISFILLLVIIVDQITKLLIINNLGLGEMFPLISDNLSFLYVRNEGAAFSILEGKRLFFIVLGFVSIFIVYKMFIKNKRLKKIERLSLGLLLGGIIGNLIDRIIYGYVIDFISVRLLGYPFPIFNIADTAIVVGAAMLIIYGGKDERNKR